MIDARSGWIDYARKAVRRDDWLDSSDLPPKVSSYLQNAVALVVPSAAIQSARREVEHAVDHLADELDRPPTLRRRMVELRGGALDALKRLERLLLAAQPTETARIIGTL